MKDELSRRASLTDAVEAYFRARPLIWIPMAELVNVGGLGGWRTRVSECRAKRGLDILHNGKTGYASAYLFRPYQPLGRDAGTMVSARLPGL